VSGLKLKFAEDRETDPHRLAQRQKQIDYGKNTRGYDLYLASVPRCNRRKGDPVTPDRGKAMSKRAFDGLIRVWRRELHKWDPPDLLAAEAALLPTGATNHQNLREEPDNPHLSPSSASSPKPIKPSSEVVGDSSMPVAARAGGGQASFSSEIYDVLDDNDGAGRAGVRARAGATP
ncbi:unnamed protein product, partial [Discosporangium mesarthrocarpum]